MCSSPHYIFRKLRSAEEILAQFRLRCRVYAATPHLGCLLDPVCLEAGIEADAYDRYSDQYGLFEYTGAEESLIGTLRVTGPDLTPSAGIVEKALEDHPALLKRVRSPRASILPGLDYLPGCEEMHLEVETWVRLGRSVFEAGRLTLDSAIRVSNPLAGARLARHFTRCACALPLTQPYDVVIVSCLASHSAYYVRHGFCRIDGLQDVLVPQMGVRYTAHRLIADAITDDALSRLEPVARAYLARGRVCACGDSGCSFGMAS